MKVLLIRSPVTESTFGVYPPMIPIGLGFLANSIMKFNIEVEILDLYLESYLNINYESKLKDKITSFEPDIIGFSVFTIEYAVTIQLIEHVRLLSNAQIIVGGPHSTLYPQTLLDYADAIFIGESEESLPNYLIKKYNLIKIKTYEFNGKKVDIIEPICLPKLNNLNSPLVPWSKFKIERYNIFSPDVGLINQPIINLNTSRGCPYNCNFCSVPELTEFKYRIISTDVIIEEIKYLQEKYKIKGIYFREDNFTANKKRVKEISQALIDNRIDIDWATESRIDTLDENLIKLMAKSGCKGLLIGFETFSEKVMKSINKPLNIEHTLNNINLLHKYNIKIKASFMFGSDGESEADREITLGYIKQLNFHDVEISIYIGIPGSAAYDKLLLSKEFEYFDNNNKIIYPKGFLSLYKKYILDYKQKNRVIPYTKGILEKIESNQNLKAEYNKNILSWKNKISNKFFENV